VFLGAIQADEYYRELPILIRAENQHLIEGTIDLVFRKEGIWYIVDYKTDRELDRRKAAYENQLNWYAYGLSEIYKTRLIKGLLLGI
jgi:ATP-dependent helicase/nuclease subunit A